MNAMRTQTDFGRGRVRETMQRAAKELRAELTWENFDPYDPRGQEYYAACEDELARIERIVADGGAAAQHAVPMAAAALLALP